MRKRVISDDRDSSGILTSFHYDQADDSFVIQKEQDVAGIIEANKVEFNDAPTRWGEWTKVGSIPLTIYFDLQKKGILQDQKALAKWLNDPDNRAFRTRPGTI
jgi:hypothetical protein